MKNIINKYIKKDYPDDIRRIFGWLLINSDDEDKEESISQVWDNSESEFSTQTIEELNKFRKRIKADKEKSHFRWLNIAVAILIFALAGGIVFLLLKKNHYETIIADQEMEQYYVAGSDTAEVMLSDGTKVLLGSGSTLLHPKKFSGNHRSVFLTGQAKFNVAKDEKHPFVVHAQNISITALGTEFDVYCYDDSKYISTTLSEGSTKVNINDIHRDQSKKEYYLYPNQQLIFEKATGNVNVKEVDVTKEFAWTKGNLVLENAEFSQIISALQRKYGVRFVCENIDKLGGSYNAYFYADETIEDVLEILQQTSHKFVFRREGNVIYLKAE